MHRLVTSLQSALPAGLRKALLGSPDSPSWFADMVHSVLNWMPVRRFPTLPCRGPLEGYQMKIDWHRYRSFVYGTWEKEVVASLTKNVSEGSVVFDVGAHIGFYTLLLAKLVGPGGRVYSFEPLPENFKLLSENVERNRCSNVRLVRKAVMVRSGPIRVTVPNSEPVPGSVSLTADYGTPPITVEAITLDEFAAPLSGPIHLIKMDVEGAEHQVLLGGERTIRDHRPNLMIELHHFDPQREDQSALSLLTRWDYRVEWLNRMPETSHIFARPQERSREGKPV